MLSETVRGSGGFVVAQPSKIKLAPRMDFIAGTFDLLRGHAGMRLRQHKSELGLLRHTLAETSQYLLKLLKQNVWIDPLRIRRRPSPERRNQAGDRRDAIAGSMQRGF